jgi:MFS family permease
MNEEGIAEVEETCLDASAAGTAEAAPAAAKPRPWRSRAFLLLCGGQALSEAGSQITAVALPVVAVVTLHATALELSVLSALRYLPFLLFGALAGVWIDRVRRRPLMLRTDVSRALLVGLVPILHLAGLLDMADLLLIVFALGVLRVLFDVSYQSFLPSVVSDEDLLAANTGLETMASASRLAGPGLAGILVGALTAPVAVLADAASFAASALSLTLIRAEEQPTPRTEHEPIGRALATGFRTIWDNRTLRSLIAVSGLCNLSLMTIQGIYFIFTLQTLHLSVLAASAIQASDAVGLLIGSALSTRVGRRLGRTGAMKAAMLAMAVGSVLIAAADGLVLLGAGYLVWGMAFGIFNVHSVSYRQQTVPRQILGTDHRRLPHRRLRLTRARLRPRRHDRRTERGPFRSVHRRGAQRRGLADPSADRAGRCPGCSLRPNSNSATDWPPRCG